MLIIFAAFALFAVKHPPLSSVLLFAAESAARAVGVAVWTDGSLLVADDDAGKIWRVSAKE